ncbi:hypothetical protein SISSUDRAFT_1061097 [Sistotremastrum suecicum HHB10207 ss-3]|uniref:Uncharacterized protein n=1 Tax=Sistotremastrum suecicum HHB10207 ss-3 TaxID=1314776 RepID=A0A166EE83_9AGAM|nr:hypothetical protein SISSUDRAFT_1061097 [Sistotremastrum suecicum HHB10207 ss-3]
MLPKQYPIKVEGRIYWDLVFFYNNKGNSGTITHEIEAEIIKSYNVKTFREDISKVTRNELEKIGVEAEASASYGPVSAKVAASYENSKEINDLFETTTRTEKETDTVTKTTIRKKFEVGPESQLSLYQKCFSSPGIQVKFETLTTDVELGKEVIKVPIDVVVQPIEYIQDIQVIFGSSVTDAPDDRVRDITKNSDDVNWFGDGAYYAWLVPVYTSDPDKAATAFNVAIEGTPREGNRDLAKGSPRAHRYLDPEHDTRNPQKIGELALYRCTNIPGFPVPDQTRSLGYEGSTKNINEGRQIMMFDLGLFLIWKPKRAW